MKTTTYIAFPPSIAIHNRRVSGQCVKQPRITLIFIICLISVIRQSVAFFVLLHFPGNTQPLLETIRATLIPFVYSDRRYIISIYVNYVYMGSAKSYS